jgi:hypothetical protein
LDEKYWNSSHMCGKHSDYRHQDVFRDFEVFFH